MPTGTPNKVLQSLPPADLAARYLSLRQATTASNYVPMRLRAAPDPQTQQLRRVQAREITRIQSIARLREIPLPSLAPKQAAPERYEPESGDKVQVEYRNPQTGATEQGMGEIVRLEWSLEVGGIYHTRVNGSIYQLSRRSILKVLKDEESQ